MEKFTISESVAGVYGFNLLSRTGKVLLIGIGLTSREACLSQIEKVRKFSQERKRFDRHLLTSSKFYFNLEGTNGCIIAVSPLFDQFSDAAMGIDCVIKYGQTSNVEDLTFTTADTTLLMQ